MVMPVMHPFDGRARSREMQNAGFGQLGASESPDLKIKKTPRVSFP